MSIFAKLSLRFVGWTVEKKGVHVEIVDPGMVPPQCHAAATALQSFGFRYCCCASSRPGNLAPMYSVFLLDAEGHTFGRVSDDGSSEGTQLTLISYFPDGQQLATCVQKIAIANPRHLTQLMPGLPPAELVGAHRDRLERLRAQGMVPIPVAPEELIVRFRDEWYEDIRGWREFGTTNVST